MLAMVSALAMCPKGSPLDSSVSGTMKTGERITARGCDFYSFRDGKIVKKDSFWKIVEKA